MEPFPQGRMRPVPFSRVAVVDTETTGLWSRGLTDDGSPSGDPHGPDRICAMGVVVLARTAGRWVEEGSACLLFDPSRPVGEKAAMVNGFSWTPGMPSGPFTGERRGGNLAGLPLHGSRPAAAIRSLLGSLPVVAHNAPFDVGFIDAALEDGGLPPLDVPTFCTKAAYSDSLGLGRPDSYVPRTGLDALCEALGVSLEARRDGHGALVDARLAGECFTRLDSLGWMEPRSAASMPHRAQACCS